MSGDVNVALQIATGDEEIPPGADWQAWVNAALDAAEVDMRLTGCVTLRLVGRSESQHLNEMYRHRLGPTNVLAFSGHDDATLPEADRELGDLVVCLPVVNDEAQQQGKASLAHLAHMIVHGTLHLAGFHHEDDAAAARMEALETQIMLGLGFPAPYEAAGNSPPDDSDDGG